MTALIGGNAGQHFGPRTHLDLVHPQHKGPITAQPRQHRMIRLQHIGHGAFRHFDPVIPRVAGHRQYILDRGVAPARLAVDALKAEIAPDHQQPAAPFHPRLDQAQPVRHGLRPQPDGGGQQERIGPDI